MKTKLTSFLTLLLLLVLQTGWAQTSINGVVTDQAGLPLPGVNVLVKGTQNGVQTDFDGKFSITANAGDMLVFSFVGMKTVEAAAAPNMNIKMADNAVELEGVVVTALGIKREKKSLDYSSQKLDGSDVDSRPTNNFLNNLSGKVAGLEVRTNGNFGGSTNIVLRGTKSMTHNNQALIVVDGVPVTNTNFSTADAKNARDGYDYGNSASDIDPSNIESVNVLKGAAATALYGSDAANGAILITTKKGKQNQALGISFSSTYSTGTIDKTTFPTYQKRYGGGGYDGHDNLIVVDVNGDGVDDLLDPTGYDISYGNEFDPNLLVYQWNAFAPGGPHFGQPTPWVGAKNDPSSFFERSQGMINTVNMNGGDDKSSFNFNFTNNQETGVLPNSKLNKNMLNGAFSHDFTDKLKVGATFNYIDQETIGRNNVGYGDNILGGFRQWWQVNTDVKELQREYFRDHQNITWNMNDPLNGDLTPAYWDNPYFTRFENYQNDSRRRFITGASISYDITSNFNVLARATIENSIDRAEERKAIGSVAAEWGVAQLDDTSGYDLYTRSFAQQTYDFIATYDLKINEDIGAKLLGGGTFRHSSVDSFHGSTTGGLVLPGLYTLGNSQQFFAPTEGEVYLKKSGFYAQASFDFKKALYLEGTFRQDKSTSLPQNSNTYNYFSVGTSFVFSEFIKVNWLQLAKLRASYAEVGNDTDPGTLGAKTFATTIDGYPAYGNSTTYADFDKLKPERVKSWELGLEAGMFKNRVNFDVSLYKSNTINQIFNVPQSTSTGASFAQVNAGELENKGVEVSMNLVPVKTKDFEWSLSLNWAKNRNKVVSLGGGRDNLVLASFQSGITLNATVGQPYGTLQGVDFVYDDHGNRIVGDDGNYLQSDTNDHVIGNIQADWTGGINNRFTYKDFTLGFLIDIKKGGDVFSLDQGYGQDTGLYPETAGYNDLGNPVRNTLDNGGGIIHQGVMANPDYVPGNGQPQYIKNTIRVDTSDSSEASGLGYGISANPDKAFVYDASYVKLREVSFGYNLPTKYLDHTFFKGISFSIIGNNVWIIHKNLPYADPEAGTSSGNIQGYQSGVMPTVRTWSFNIKANF